jgi:hypothetical protein
MCVNFHYTLVCADPMWLDFPYILVFSDAMWLDFPYILVFADAMCLDFPYILVFSDSMCVDFPYILVFTDTMCLDFLYIQVSANATYPLSTCVNLKLIYWSQFLVCPYVLVFADARCLGCPCGDHTASLPTPVLVWRHARSVQGHPYRDLWPAGLIVTLQYSHHSHPPRHT